MGVAHALDSDNIEADSTSTIFARKSDKTRTNIPPADSTQNGAGLSNYQQKVMADLKFRVDNKLARDKVVRQERLKNLTWRDNPNKCNQTTHWIAAESPFYCIKKKTAVTPSSSASPPVPRVYHHAPVAGNTYYWGNCTWGVKNWRPDIPNNWGNASDWLYNAQRAGWATGSTPRMGAVGWSANHVVLVVSVNPLRIKEMNYAGLGSVRTRPASAGEFFYIY